MCTNDAVPHSKHLISVHPSKLIVQQITRSQKTQLPVQRFSTQPAVHISSSSTSSTHLFVQPLVTAGRAHLLPHIIIVIVLPLLLPALLILLLTVLILIITTWCARNN